jgi:hypothetical protein
MFQAIMKGDIPRLRQTGEKFYQAGNTVAALLCFDHVFKTVPRMIVAKSKEMAGTLEIFSAYVRLLRDTALHPDPCNTPSIQKLLGFRAVTERDFLLPTGSFLYRYLSDYGNAAFRSSDDGAVVSTVALARMFRECLCDRLRHRVLQEDDMCRRAEAFSPCLGFGVYSVCNRPECPQVHVDTWSITPDWFNLRIRIHLQQILIIQTLQSTVSLQQWDKIRQQWYGKG